MSGIVEFHLYEGPPSVSSPSIVPFDRSVSVAIGKPIYTGQTRPQRILHHPSADTWDCGRPSSASMECPVAHDPFRFRLLLFQRPANFAAGKKSTEPNYFYLIFSPHKCTFYLASIGAIWFLINPSQFRNIRWLHWRRPTGWVLTNNSRMMMTKIIVISVSSWPRSVSSTSLEWVEYRGRNSARIHLLLFLWFIAVAQCAALIHQTKPGSTSSGRIMKWREEI